MLENSSLPSFHSWNANYTSHVFNWGTSKAYSNMGAFHLFRTKIAGKIHHGYGPQLNIQSHWDPKMPRLCVYWKTHGKPWCSLVLGPRPLNKITNRNKHIQTRTINDLCGVSSKKTYIIHLFLSFCPVGFQLFIPTSAEKIQVDSSQGITFCLWT